MLKQPRFMIGLRAWLMILSVFSALPMIAFSISSVSFIARGQYAVEADQLRKAAVSLAHDLDAYFDSKEAMLRTLVASDAAMRGDIDEVYRHARRIALRASDEFAIALVDRDGRIIFHTMRIFDAPLGETSEKAQILRVLATGDASVSPAYDDPVSKRRVASLDVPMSGELFQRYCLRAVIAVADVEALLIRRQFPANWTAAFQDRDKLVAGARFGEDGAAETFGHGRDGGLRPLAPEETASPRGELLEEAAADVGQWGWRAVVNVTESTFALPLRTMLLRFAAAAVVCLALGLAAAYGLAKRLSREMRTLLEPSGACAEGGEAAPLRPGVGIREIGEVRACLLAARDREQQAKINSLTGLAGRALFWELSRGLTRASQGRPGLDLAVLYIDLDGFKQVNDVHGHDRGDWVLRRAAEMLREEVGDKAVVGRLGGDEFAVCLAAPAGQAQAAAERLVARMGTIGYGVGCSIGVSVCQSCSPSLSRGLALADQAMYEAKRLGKGRYVLREDTTLDID